MIRGVGAQGREPLQINYFKNGMYSFRGKLVLAETAGPEKEKEVMREEELRVYR